LYLEKNKLLQSKGLFTLCFLDTILGNVDNIDYFILKKHL